MASCLNDGRRQQRESTVSPVRERSGVTNGGGGQVASIGGRGEDVGGADAVSADAAGLVERAVISEGYERRVTRVALGLRRQRHILGQPQRLVPRMRGVGLCPPGPARTSACQDEG